MIKIIFYYKFMCKYLITVMMILIVAIIVGIPKNGNAYSTAHVYNQLLVDPSFTKPSWLFVGGDNSVYAEAYAPTRFYNPALGEPRPPSYTDDSQENGNLILTNQSETDSISVPIIFELDYWTEGSSGDSNHYAYLEWIEHPTSFVVSLDPLETTSYDLYAYAYVEGGTTAVPIPSAAWLFASGLIGLAGFRKKLRKR